MVEVRDRKWVKLGVKRKKKGLRITYSFLRCGKTTIRHGTVTLSSSSNHQESRKKFNKFARLPIETEKLLVTLRKSLLGPHFGWRLAEADQHFRFAPFAPI